MKIKIADATAGQLKDFAETHLGLDVPEGRDKGAVMAILTRAGYRENEIEIPDAVKPARKVTAAAMPAGAISESDLTGLMVTVLLPEQEHELEMEFVSVNGNGMYIRRGEPSSIKYEYFRVLENAKKVIYEQTERDGLGTPRMVSAFPIQIIDMDPMVRAFREQQRSAA